MSILVSGENRIYFLPVEESLRLLGSREEGLTAGEALARLRVYGGNELKAKRHASLAVIFLRQLASPLVYILLAAAVIKVFIKGIFDALVIAAVLLLIALIGFIQEVKAQKSMEALLKQAVPKARVRREGTVVEIAAAEIVRGDIVLLETGDKVPADCRLTAAIDLKVNESAFTGESLPVDKSVEPLSEDTGLAGRRNMVYMGTAVTYGRGTAVCSATGMETEIGRITAAVSGASREKTPLQKSIDTLGSYLILVVLFACAFIFAMGMVRNLGLLDLLMFAVAAAVSAIPEGLPVAVTVVLAAGVQVMARRNAIVRRLAAVETLGSTTVICSDKTGTLTQNELRVRRLYSGGWIDAGSGTAAEKTMLTIAAVCSDVVVSAGEGGEVLRGDPTEIALVAAAQNAGLDRETLERDMPRLDEIPFASEQKFMATLNKRGARTVVCVKGSPDVALSFSARVLRDGKESALTVEDSGAIRRAEAAMAGDGMRVIAVCYGESGPADFRARRFRGGLVFAGLIGMSDPPRADAKRAIARCVRAGIKVVMITGDNMLTALSIARQLSLPHGRAVNGRDLARMDDRELERSINDVSVFARIEPLDKLRIVKALKRRGHVAAMTGDGVNDVPALETADIGVAMGVTGTDVAKESADMILTDDNFSSIVTAVEEGRAIFDRLRFVLFFLLTTSFGELALFILSVTLLGVAPLVPLQILWGNLITGSIMAVPLGLEPKAGDELSRPPRDPGVSLLFPGLLARSIVLAAMLGVSVMGFFHWRHAMTGIAEARTMAFCSMIVFEWLIALNARSDKYTVFELGFFRNKALMAALALAVVLQLCVVYVPFLQKLFETVPLSLYDWALAVMPGTSIFAVETVRKTYFPRLFSAGKWTAGSLKRRA